MPFDSLPQADDAQLDRLNDASRHALLLAAELIESRGLAKEIRQDYDGRLCIHGAVSMAFTGNVDGFSMDLGEFSDGGAAMRAVARYVKARGGRVFGNDYRPAVAYWNNMPERTQAEVVAALRGAAAEYA